MKEIKVQLIHPEAKVPTKAYEGDLGWDFYIVDDETFNNSDQLRVPSYILGRGETKTFSTGVCLGLPEGYGMILKDRSSLASKHSLHILAGVIDSSYVGQILIVISNLGEKGLIMEKGMKIAQGILVPMIPSYMYPVKELKDSQRGQAGFGSSGNT